MNSDEAAATNGTGDRKVQFDPKLEKGPTPSTGEKKEPVKSALSPQAKTEAAKPKKEKITLANGVVVEEHKAGSGPKAKNGAKLGIRYIGKLAKNGKEFDSNRKGKPFRFTLGKGEVIKGNPVTITLLMDRLGYWTRRNSTWRGAQNHYPCRYGLRVEEITGYPTK